MTNAFMAEYYRDQTAALNSAQEAQAELVNAYTTKLANSTPTPTTAELDAILSGTPTPLNGDGTPPTTARKVSPGHFNLRLQRKPVSKK